MVTFYVQLKWQLKRGGLLFRRCASSIARCCGLYNVGVGVCKHFVVDH